MQKFKIFILQTLSSAATYYFADMAMDNVNECVKIDIEKLIYYICDAENIPLLMSFPLSNKDLQMITTYFKYLVEQIDELTSKMSLSTHLTGPLQAQDEKEIASFWLLTAKQMLKALLLQVKQPTLERVKFQTAMSKSLSSAAETIEFYWKKTLLKHFQT